MLKDIQTLTLANKQGNSVTFKAFTDGATNSKSMLLQIITLPTVKEGEALEKVLIGIFNFNSIFDFTNLVKAVDELNIYRFNKQLD